MALAGRNASLPATKRTARVILCLYREHLVALHGFIKKTRTTPDEDLALARKRQKELMR
jgi:phage-related protein